MLVPNLYELEGNSIDGWAEQVWDGFDDDFAAVGLSMGGYVALALARLAGERSRGLFLAGARVGADDADRQAPATPRSRRCASRASTRGRRARPRRLRQSGPWRS